MKKISHFKTLMGPYRKSSRWPLNGSIPFSILISLSKSCGREKVVCILSLMKIFFPKPSGLDFWEDDSWCLDASGHLAWDWVDEASFLGISLEVREVSRVFFCLSTIGMYKGWSCWWRLRWTDEFSREDSKDWEREFLHVRALREL